MTNARITRHRVYRALVAFPLLLLLDVVWLVINRSNYNRLVYAVQGRDLRLHYGGGALSYLFLYIALVCIALPAMDSDTAPAMRSSLRHAGLLGLCVYGVFNATNLAIFNRYRDWMAIVDTLWGGILLTLVASAVFWWIPCTPDMD